MSTSNGQITRPKVKEIAGTLASATTKVDLAATYADIGTVPAKNINNLHDPTLYLAEIANSENAVVKFFASPDTAQPSASTSLYQIVNAAGAEIEVTITQNTKQSYNLAGLAAHWFILQAKGAVGTAADLRAFLTGNFPTDGRGSKFVSKKKTIAGTAVALGASPVLVGNIIDIRGWGHVTLFVQNTDASVNATITPYVAYGNTAPTALSDMFAQKTTVPAKVTYVTLANERAAHPLGLLSGDWLAIEASGLNADIIVYAMGHVSGHIG